MGSIIKTHEWDIINFLMSFLSIVAVTILRFQIEKAKNWLQIQSQYYAETRYKLWVLWELYYAAANNLSDIILKKGPCRSEEYEKAYQNLIEGKSWLSPVIPYSLDKALDKFIEIFEPTTNCDKDKIDKYKNIHHNIIKYFRKEIQLS